MKIRALSARILVALIVNLTTFGIQHNAKAEPSGVGSDKAVDKGLVYLRRTQKKDGSWSEHPALTAVSVSAFLLNGRTEKSEPAVARGVQYILRQAKPNGSICLTGKPSITLPNYNTSLCLIALAQTKNPAYRPAIDRGVKYLEERQYGESRGIKPSNPMYGGIGYGDDPGDELHPDLSNLHHALEALHECGVPATAPVFKKALVYLQRVQNRRETNDQPWAKQGPNDGGFLYESQGETKSPLGNHASYGAMTYAGLKCLTYCGVPKSDPRVQAAWSWISAHYTLSQHPHMGQDSLYYYYRTMAMSLDAFGQKTIVDHAGKKHIWARELADKMVSLQHPDGSWYGTKARWFENRPDLITPYGLIVLAYCRKNGA